MAKVQLRERKGEAMPSSRFDRAIHWGRRCAGPLLLIILCPPLVMLVWYTNVFLEGSVRNLYALFAQQGVFSTIYAIWKPVFFGTVPAWKMLALFVGVELVLMKILPGKKIQGPMTPKGNTPMYKANGMMSFLFTVGLFLLGSLGLGLFSPGIIYDHLGGLLGTLNLFSLVFCLFLYFKGRYKPSTIDSGTTGGVIFDYFWGMELHPRLWGWDIKMFTNCRFGMISWGLILISFAAKQYELYGLANSMLIAVALQLLFVIKFFVWEQGFLQSMDIMHDRAGFCLCWGCMVWVPAVYTSPALFLVNHPYRLGPLLFLVILLSGIACIFINYLADRQRQRVRGNNGQCMIWKRKPELIFANYKTEWGEERQSLLLVSGWWGVSRHFHYLPEILAAFFWSMPALFGYYMPYFYLTFLILLLLDRAYRQERRCAMKYGQDWNEYCKRVPFRLIPFVY